MPNAPSGPGETAGPIPTNPEIVILTGAGVSAESGLGTFRDEDGLWAHIDLEEVATPEGFARNPAKVHDFYNFRRRALLGAEPNAAHHALARLEAARPGSVLIVTQNVDDLHERAGSKAVLHMHGELLKSDCTACGDHAPCAEDLSESAACPVCGARGSLRPAVVWFGEMPHHLGAIRTAIASARLFVSIGTSGQVYPAAAFCHEAAEAGAETLELNLEPTAHVFEQRRLGRATEVTPAWVDEILGAAER